MPRGTEIVLHLKDDAKKYLEPHEIRRVVSTYSDHILFPIELTGPGSRRGRRGDRAEDRADQFGERAVAAAEIRAEAGGLQAGLPDHRARLRRSRDDAALPRRGPLFLRGAAVRALDAAVRPVRSGAQGAREALRAPRLHHRRCGPAAVLPALHPRRGRQRGPAAQHLARDAAEQSAGRGRSARRSPAA